MIDPRIRPEAMLRVGAFFAANGDRDTAARAYRDVIHADEAACAAEALRRLDDLDRIDWLSSPLHP